GRRPRRARAACRPAGSRTGPGRTTTAPAARTRPRASPASEAPAASKRQGRVGGAREAGWYYRRRSLGTSMRGRFNIIQVVGVVLVALAGVACSGATEKSSIEILDWWKQGGEAEAIGALLDVYKQQN